MKPSKVYEITSKRPSFGWSNKITIRQAVYEALKELKRADVPKIVGTVLAHHPDLPTKQKDQRKQIQFTLWQFTREGLAREHADRRWRQQREPAIAQGTRKRKRKIA